jgi:hypothetical protein
MDAGRHPDLRDSMILKKIIPESLRHWSSLAIIITKITGTVLLIHVNNRTRN